MTNGEKFVKTFPDLANIERYRDKHKGTRIEFESIWWDAEYKEPSAKVNQDLTENDNITITFPKGTFKHTCKDYVTYKKSWLRSHYGAEIDIMFDDNQYESNKLEIPSSSDNNLSSELEENSKELENASLIIDWNNCHTSDKFDSIATAGFMHYYTEVWADGFIKALEQELRWIPVSERLPEDHKDVLVYLSSDRMSICRYNSHKLPFSNNPIGWGYVPGMGFMDFEKEQVIAWMPLPKAYKEVEE